MKYQKYDGKPRDKNMGKAIRHAPRVGPPTADEAKAELLAKFRAKMQEK